MEVPLCHWGRIRDGKFRRLPNVYDHCAMTQNFPRTVGFTAYKKSINFCPWVFKLSSMNCWQCYIISVHVVQWRIQGISHCVTSIRSMDPSHLLHDVKTHRELGKTLNAAKYEGILSTRRTTVYTNDPDMCLHQTLDHTLQNQNVLPVNLQWSTPSVYDLTNCLILRNMVFLPWCNWMHSAQRK